MSSLFVYPVASPQMPDKVLNHLEDIASTLAGHGVIVERRDVAASLRPGADADEVIAAVRGQLDRLMTERGYTSVEVISLDSDQTPAEWLDEHFHGDDEMRLFVAGRGLLNLHIGDYVYALLCEKSDLVSIPAGIRQWFDFGERPCAIAIRLFRGAEGGRPTFTGDPIAGQCQRLEE